MADTTQMDPMTMMMLMNAMKGSQPQYQAAGAPAGGISQATPANPIAAAGQAAGGLAPMLLMLALRKKMQQGQGGTPAPSPIDPAAAQLGTGMAD